MEATSGVPTFLFIGPDKTGSTWLYEILRAHPECYVPPIKDIYFFDRHYDRGLDWYLSQFRDAPPEARAIGELSHDYLFSRQAAERIAQDLPDVKLLTCLRDPVERTFSHYLFMVRSGRTRMPFEEALEGFPELVENSLYAKHLRVYFELFPAERIKVLMFEQLRADSATFAAEAFEFLGLRFIDDLPYEKRTLGAARPRSHLLARAVKVGTDVARQLGLTRLVGRLKHSSRIQKLLYKRYRRGTKPTIDPETADRLRETFRPDIEDLERLLDRDFGHWLPGRETARGEVRG